MAVDGGSFDLYDGYFWPFHDAGSPVVGGERLCAGVAAWISEPVWNRGNLADGACGAKMCAFYRVCGTGSSSVSGCQELLRRMFGNMEGNASVAAWSGCIFDSFCG